MAEHYNESDTRPDDAGWFYPKCACGWKGSVVPDLDLLIDEMVYHAYQAGLMRREFARRDAGLPPRRVR